MKTKENKKNENLLAIMKKKEISLRLLSQFTDIPETTLSRIINNHVKSVKPKYIDSISKALDVPSYSIFQSEKVEQPLLAAIRPENAGAIITKTLCEDESLLLYFYQISALESRKKILEKARHEAQLSQIEIFAKDVDFKIRDNDDSFEQLKLDV